MQLLPLVNLRGGHYYSSHLRWQFILKTTSQEHVGVFTFCFLLLCRVSAESEWWCPRPGAANGLSPMNIYKLVTQLSGRQMGLSCSCLSTVHRRPLLARGCLPRVVCPHIIICSMGRARRREDEWRRIRIKGIHETIVTDIVSIEVVVCRTLFPSHYIIIICIFQGTDNNSPGEQEEDWRPRRRHIQISFKGTQARMRIAACSS